MDCAQTSTPCCRKLGGHAPFLIALAIACTVPAGAAGQGPASPPPSPKPAEVPTGPANAEEIERLIEDLGAAAFAERTYAMRRLCAIGMPAAERLRVAAQSQNTEQALRARKLLTTFDRLLFAGVEVTLAVNPISAWDDPLHVSVTFTNRSDYPARLPFEADSARRAELSAETRQVGDLLDLAEWLTVRNPAGHAVNLRVDELNAQEDIAAALQDRLTGGPVTVLESGQRVTVECRNLNRSWARYPLFERGTYTFVLEYVPQWEDEVLAAQRLGRVRSNELTVKVSKPAPEKVARSGASSSLTLASAGEHYVVRLTNHWDLPVLVNRNFGPEAPFASGCWTARVGGRDYDLLHLGREHTSWEAFSAGQLVEVAAGESLELARIAGAELQTALTRHLSADQAVEAEVFFRYSNVCSRTWQAVRGKEVLGNPQVPAVLRQLLPANLLAAEHLSNAVRPAGPAPERDDVFRPALEPDAPAP